MNFTICGIVGQFCGTNQTLKRGRKTFFKMFPVKNLAFKIFIFIPVCQIFEKSCFCDLFIFDNVIRNTLKVPSIRILLSSGSLNGKNRLSEGHPRFSIKISVCKSSN